METSYSNSNLQVHGQWESGLEPPNPAPNMYMRIDTEDVSRSGNTLSLVIKGRSTDSLTGMNKLTNDYGRYFGYSFNVYAQLDGGNRTLLFSKDNSPGNWDDSAIVLTSDTTISVINTTSTTSLKIWFKSQCDCVEPESSDGGLVLNIALDAPPAAYTVTFVDGWGTTLKTQTVNYGENATPPANPTHTGYEFIGWDGTYANVTSDRTITAQWQIKTYTVTFVDGWGSTLKTQTVNYGQNATPPSNPTHSGYQFTGWSGAYTNVTSNRTITAQWKILPIWIYNGSSWQRIKKAYRYQSGSWVEITPKIFNGTSWVDMT